MSKEKKVTKQIRLDEKTYGFIESIAAKQGQPTSTCAKMMVDLVRTLVDEVERDGRVFIETSDKEKMLLRDSLLQK